MYDLIIIGMGISGITAAIYAKRANLKVLLLEKKMPGGIINEISQITNYPGIQEISGPDLAQNLLANINYYHIEYKLEEVSDVILEDIKTIKTNQNTYQSKYLLIATGRKPKLLGLEHEEEFLGKGISTCALCDGFFYRDKTVAVVGGGSSAVGEALYLAKLVQKLYLIHRRLEFRCDKELFDQLKSLPNVEILTTEEIKSLIIKDNKIVGLKLINQDISIDGLFEYIGFKPNSEFLSNTSLMMEDGYLLVNEKNETNIDGVYASGDIIKSDIYQILTAASQGAQVAINISKRK